MKPCEFPCRKCGSTSIKRHFFKVGASTIPVFDSRKLVYSDLEYFEEFKGKFLESWGHKAKRDCILHNCVVCEYTWDSLPLSENKTELP